MSGTDTTDCDLLAVGSGMRVLPAFGLVAQPIGLAERRLLRGR